MISMDIELKKLVENYLLPYIDIVDNDSMDKITKLFFNKLIFVPETGIEYLYMGIYCNIRLYDDKNALLFYKKAADEGIISANSYIGRIHFIYRKYDEAIIYFKTAYELGWVDAIHNLLDCYRCKENYMMFFYYANMYLQLHDKNPNYVNTDNPARHWANIKYVIHHIKTNIEAETMVS